MKKKSFLLSSSISVGFMVSMPEGKKYVSSRLLGRSCVFSSLLASHLYMTTGFLTFFCTRRLWNFRCFHFDLLFVSTLFLLSNGSVACTFLVLTFLFTQFLQLPISPPLHPQPLFAITVSLITVAGFMVSFNATASVIVTLLFAELIFDLRKDYLSVSEIILF